MNESDDGDAGMVAYDCLVSVRKILSLSLTIDVYRKAFLIVEPIITFCLSTDGCDYFEEGIPLLTIFIYKLKPLSEKMWFFFPNICYILAGNHTGLEPVDAVNKLSLNNEKMKEYIE